MIVLIKAIQVILALSILILVHEAGHFFFAKLFGIRVDKFYLFFDAGDVKLLSTKEGWFARIFPKAKEWETEYGIGWLPLGGYCKIAGMIDESMDTDHLKSEPQSWEFRSKPAWQRLLVMAGGVLMNFICAIVIYSGILAGWGESYVSNDENCIYVNELAYDMGFRNGDRILSFDDFIPEDFGMLQANLVRENASKATVLRDADTVNIYIDHSRMGEILNTPGMFSLARPFIVDQVPESSPNYGAGLMADDRILSIDSCDIRFVQDAAPIMEEKRNTKVSAAILRGSDTLVTDLQVDSLGRFGIYTRIPGIKSREYTMISAIPAGFNRTFATIGGYLKDLKLVFTPSTEAYKSVGSFIAMGQIFPSTWDWYSFLNILALLSVMLGVMNLIPIPALDGGHMMFVLYEMISGRKPGDNFMYIMQIIGMILIFGLMFLAFGNDIERLFRYMLLTLMTVMAVTSCDESKKRKALLPNISGKAGEVIIVIDKGDWEGAIGSVLRDSLAAECPFLPQKEPLYTLVNVAPSGFTNLFKVHRNLVLVNVSADVVEPGVVFRQDIWAAPQCVININASDSEKAVALIKENTPKILAYLEQAERDRVIANTKKYEELSISPVVSSVLGGSPRFPSGYRIKMKTDDFVWVTYEPQYTQQSVLAFKYPVVAGQEMLSRQRLITDINAVLEKNVPGMFENTYMTIAAVVEPSLKYMTYKGHEFAEMKGLWDVHNDFMGGPFVAHAFYSRDGKDVIVLFSFVYAPKYDKRHYLRQVESILYSFAWADEEKGDRKK